MEAADFVRSAIASADATGWDNWNGGITLWTVIFSIEPLADAKLGARRTNLENQIHKRLDVVLSPTTDDGYSVKMIPKIAAIQPDWRQSSAVGLSEVTRRNIFDDLKSEGVSWNGRLDEVEFLGRLFDLKSLPSHDTRFDDAAEDIWQHRMNNPEDWDDNWIYSDERFNLLKGSSDTFLRFLCEMLHTLTSITHSLAEHGTGEMAGIGDYSPVMPDWH